jgi:hypothetical protein
VKIPLRQRQALVRSLPWVTYLKKPQPCTGFKAGTPLKAVFSVGGRPPVGLERYSCKNPARWKFRALSRSAARDGVYCWPHLVHRGLYCDEAEAARTNKKVDELLSLAVVTVEPLP